MSDRWKAWGHRTAKMPVSDDSILQLVVLVPLAVTDGQTGRIWLLQVGTLPGACNAERSSLQKGKSGSKLLMDTVSKTTGQPPVSLHWPLCSLLGSFCTFLEYLYFCTFLCYISELFYILKLHYFFQLKFVTLYKINSVKSLMVLTVLSLYSEAIEKHSLLSLAMLTAYISYVR